MIELNEVKATSLNITALDLAMRVEGISFTPRKEATDDIRRYIRGGEAEGDAIYQVLYEIVPGEADDIIRRYHKITDAVYARLEEGSEG